ncbi:MAG: PEP/pyruvate-binding domain-containing protein, partial [Solirubrobacteraceae bacterium]
MRVPPWVVLPVSARSDTDLRDMVAEAVALLGDVPFAVRSSAVGEDGAEHSFAGQFTTILGARGEAAVADAVRA